MLTGRVWLLLRLLSLSLSSESHRTHSSVNLKTIYCLTFTRLSLTPSSIPLALQLHNSSSHFLNLLLALIVSPLHLPLHTTSPNLLRHSQCALHLLLLPLRSSRTGLCDIGLSPALLPQHHLRRHRQRRHLRPGGGVARFGAAPPEEAERPAAQRRKRELASPPPPPAAAAVPSGHLGPGPRPSRRCGPLPGLPNRSGTVPLDSSGTAAAVWNPVSLRTLHGLTSILLTSCSGCQVKEIISL